MRHNTSFICALGSFLVELLNSILPSFFHSFLVQYKGY